MRIYLLLYVLSTFVYSQELNIIKGWSLLGATENFRANNVNFVCLKSIFIYKNNTFESFISSKNYNKVIDVQMGDGFWAYSDKSCTEDTKSIKKVSPIQSNATYKITFNVTWTKMTHPKNFPSAPHFSPLVGVTHNDTVVLWSIGEQSSEGMKVVAETGGTALFKSEINEFINSNNAQNVFNIEVLQSPSSKSTTFKINSKFPEITAVSMIAPSPDWFVGISNLSLIENGKWVTNKTIDLKVYDAGTDSGTLFNSSNIATSPAEIITKLTETNTDFVDGLPFIGQLIIERIN